MATIIISDPSAQSHLLSLTIMSHERTDDYTNLFNQLKAECSTQGFDLSPRWIMADGADSITAAIEICFPYATRLMCFFHFTQAVQRRLKKENDDIKKAVMKDLRSLSMSLNVECFQSRFEALKEKWRGIPELVSQDFIGYFEKEWILSKHGNWQTFHTPPGYCMTNNPCEGQNAVLKNW